MTPIADQARADEFLQRHVRLTFVTALVVPATLAVVLLGLALTPASAGGWAVAWALLGLAVLAVVSVVLVWHTVELSVFAFRREVS